MLRSFNQYLLSLVDKLRSQWGCSWGAGRLATGFYQLSYYWFVQADDNEIDSWGLRYAFSRGGPIHQEIRYHGWEQVTRSFSLSYLTFIVPPKNDFVTTKVTESSVHTFAQKMRNVPFVYSYPKWAFTNPIIRFFSTYWPRENRFLLLKLCNELRCRIIRGFTVNVCPSEKAWFTRRTNQMAAKNGEQINIKHGHQQRAADINTQLIYSALH